MNIRTYRSGDREPLVQLIKSNTPRFFRQCEIEDFKNYIDHEIEEYYVIEEGSRVIGGGGINLFSERSLARLSWDMVDPDHQGRGVGTLLTSYRLKRLEKKSDIQRVDVRTSQLVYKFYYKMGFRTILIRNDYWAQGIDLYHMRLELNDLRAQID
ncbi:MAG: GNAT family N-acetyltransferase [Saprospiraceae bacterium]|nr:GNAT family N-acetyltransferase [Saprospiraceae bacterium]